jgi:hypothetical protein
MEALLNELYLECSRLMYGGKHVKIKIHSYNIVAWDLGFHPKPYLFIGNRPIHQKFRLLTISIDERTQAKSSIGRVNPVYRGGVFGVLGVHVSPIIQLRRCDCTGGIDVNNPLNHLCRMRLFWR